MNEALAQPFLDGKRILIDKELNWTSFDVVNKLRISLRNELGVKKIKVGHAGTLDPLATGLVIICTGKATKTIDELTGLDKEYVANITMGATTPSYDRETAIDKEFAYDHITEELLKNAMPGFIGETDQVPPIYSAKQIDGKRAYNMARQGENVKMKVNRVTIYDIELLKFNLPDITLRIHCGKGTYIRSLAHDLGEKLKSGAHLSGLRRTRIGEFNVDEAENISDFIKKLKPL